MFRIDCVALLPALLVSVACAQAVEEGPVFSVASVKRFVGGPGPTLRTETDHAVRYGRIILEYLVLRAYEIEPHQLVNRQKLGGLSDKYDVVATLPEGANKQQIPAMLRSLLADRFHLVVHRETRELMAYVLTVDKGGLKLKPSSPSTQTPNQPEGEFTLWNHPVIISATGRLHLEGAMTMARLAKALGGTVLGSMGGPLVDMTGVEGEFEITLDALLSVTGPPPDSPGDAMVTLPGGRRIPADAPSLSSAFQKLGLKLESRKVPFECVVVDQVSKDPTEN